MTVSRQKRSYAPDPKPTRAERPAAKAKRRRAVAPVSEKRREDAKQYAEQRRFFLQLRHYECEARIEGVCTSGLASQVHHKRGREGSDFLDMTTWLAVCAPCHEAITNMAIDEATERGLSERRNGRTG